MDPETGGIKEFESDEAAKLSGYVPIKRNIKLKEQATHQVRMYSPCGCGSGKKFKFCCYKKSKE
jgi:uncharacterized protein YchJ